MNETVEKSRIEGQVAQILNSRELVINRGLDHGVAKGMLFSVMSSDERLRDIVDPETRKVLGSIPRVTVRVKVSEVLPNMSVAKTYDSYSTAGILSGISSLYGQRFSGTTYYQTLKKSREYSSTGYEELDPDESAVKIGDRVVEIPQREGDTGDSGSGKE